MAKPSYLPIYKEAYLLSREVYRLKAGLRKDLKFTLGEKIFETSITCIEEVILANQANDKAQHLKNLLMQIELMWTWLRLLYDTKGFSKGQFKVLSERLDELSRQANNWKKWYFNNLETT
jgi:hypothetical protein